jgi:hypothetical protein
VSAFPSDITARLIHAMSPNCTANSVTAAATAAGSNHAQVIEWIKRGYRPVPIPLGEKRCLLKGWPSFWATEAEVPNHFASSTNVGLLLGPGAGDLLDIDVDALEALPFAERLLGEVFPATLVFGRPSKRRSHFVYRAKDAKTERFIDPTVQGSGAMLVELRFEGCQTVVPRSVHPSGEIVDFDTGYIEPAVIDAVDLRKHVALIATGALLVRHWPKQGARHHASLALCGVLLRLGWDEDDVETFVTMIASDAGDEEATSRGRNARSTASRLAAAAPASGWPTMAKYFDPRVLDSIQEWLAPWAVAPSAPVTVTAPAGAGGAAHTSSPVIAPDSLVFRGVAGDLVRTIEPHTEASSIAILVQLLVGFGSLVGREAYFRVEADAHHSNEFIVLVGRSSKGRKGTSWVIKLLSAVDPQWAAERVTAGLSTGEGLMYEVRDEVTAFDKERHEEVVVDPGVADKRLLVVESEYAGVLKVIRREGNTLSVVVRNAWDRGDLRAMTKNNRVKATGAHVSIVGHITGTELVRNLTETESANGFGNRHIFFLVERSKFLPDGGNLDDKALDPFISRVRDALVFARSVGLVRRDAAARARWHAVYPTLSEGDDSLVGRLTGRAEAHVMRLAMVYALLDKSAVITVEHLDAALALWDYSLASCRAVFGDRLGDPIADAILGALRRKPEGMSRTDVSRIALGGHASSGDIAAALGLLQKRGLAVVQQVTTGGRPSELWIATTRTDVPVAGRG